MPAALTTAPAGSRSPVGDDAPHPAPGVPQQAGDGGPGAESGAGPPGGTQQPGRASGLDLGVLRVVDAAGEPGGESGLQVVEGVARHGHGVDTGEPLPRGEVRQGAQPAGAGGDDQAALGFVLVRGGPGVLLGGQFAPQPSGEQGQFEFGAGFLVGDQQVALAGAGGTAGHRARSTTRVVSPARAAYRAQAAPTIPAPTTTTSLTGSLAMTVICHMPQARTRSCTAAGAGRPAQTPGSPASPGSPGSPGSSGSLIPSSAIDSLRISTLRILPVTVIGNSSARCT